MSSGYRVIEPILSSISREMQSIKALTDPEYFFITPTGVPDPQQQIAELRLFAKEVMPHFRD